MRLLRIEGEARGRRVDLDLTAPVALFSGPTGAGKTTAIVAALWALTGEVATGSKPVKRPADCYDWLGDGEGPVEVTDHLEDDQGRTLTVTRRLVPRAGGKVDHEIETSLGGKGIGDREERLRAAIGDLRALDFGALLARGETDRRRTLLDLCQQRAAPWTAERVERELLAIARAGVARLEAEHREGDPEPLALEDVLREAGSFAPAAGEEFYGALRRHAEAADEKVRDLQRACREAQQAIEELGRQAAEGDGAASVDVLLADQRALDARLGALRQRLGQAQGRARERDRIQQRLDAIARLRPIEQIEDAAAEAGEALEQARQRLAALEAAAPAAHTPNPSIRQIAGEIAQIEQALRELGARKDSLDARAAERRAVAERLMRAPDACCPTCRGEITAERLDAIRVEFEALEAERAPIIEAIELDGVVLEALQADRQRAEDADRAARQAADAAAARWRADVEGLRRDLAAGGALVREADRVAEELEARIGADQEAEQLRGELADLDAGEGAEALRAQITEAEAERAALQRRLEDARAAEQRDLGMRTAAARRDDAERRLPAAKLACEAWLAALQAFGREALAPFADAVASLLPAGWRFRVDLDGMRFLVDTGDGAGERQVEALSRGEGTLFYGAAMAALASMASARWRPVIVDHAEALTDEGLDEGLLATFVRALAIAHEGGAIDQAILATGRLGRRERAAVERAGAQVVRFGGAPPDEPGDDDALEPEAPNDFDDDEPDDPRLAMPPSGGVPAAYVRWAAQDYLQLLSWVETADGKTSVGVDALRALHDAAQLGNCDHLSGPTMRRRLANRYAELNVDPERVRDAVAHAVAEHPVRRRSEVA